MFRYTTLLLLVCCVVIDAKALVQKNHQIEINDRNEKPSMNTNDQSVDGLLSQVFSKQRLLGQQLGEFRDLEELLRRNIHQDIKNWGKRQPDAKVGFGGMPQGDPKRILFANATIYVNKVINQAQQRLKQYGSRIYANIPPYVIYKIPRTPITFVLKSVEGASTITPQGTSMALHYFDSLFTYTQFKFQEIMYNYEVQIKPMDLFTIRKSLTVVLENARAWMPVALENGTFTIQRFEFVQPDVTVEAVNDIYINHLINDILIDKYYPGTKEKLADIVSRDTKLLLDAQVKDSQ